jgi:hypothetical protein
MAWLFTFGLFFENTPCLSIGVKAYGCHLSVIFKNHFQSNIIFMQPGNDRLIISRQLQRCLQRLRTPLPLREYELPEAINEQE